VSHYDTLPLGGFHVIVVEAGTTVTDERSGDEAVITDTSCCTKGDLLYCTQAVFDALKAHIQRAMQ
jgi:hypothetical protein